KMKPEEAEKILDDYLLTLDIHDVYSTVSVVKALVQHNPEKYSDLLIEELQNGIEEKRKQLIRFAGELKHQPAMHSLLAISQNEEATYTLCEASIRALGMLGAYEAVAPLINQLSNDNLNIVVQVIEALGEIGDERAIPHLTPFLDDNRGAYYANWHMYQFAEIALKKFEHPDADNAINETFIRRNNLNDG
ncbi:MAG: HEAT repeat domain-containing protein, partial [Chloroflexota bacterium]